MLGIGLSQPIVIAVVGIGCRGAIGIEYLREPVGRIKREGPGILVRALQAGPAAIAVVGKRGGLPGPVRFGKINPSPFFFGACYFILRDQVAFNTKLSFN